MRKLKLLLAALALTGGGAVQAQEWTDVTNTYITNASLVSDYFGSSDNTWWPVYTTGRTGNTQHPKSWYLHTNGTTNHNINTVTGFFECWTANQGVKRWTLFQDITLPAGKYQLTGQYSTNESRGIIKTVAITPHHSYFSSGITSSNWGNWGSETAEFTLYEETKVRVGMIATNFAQNHGFTLTTTGAKQLLTDVIASAPSAVSTTDAQNVLDDGSSDDAAYRSAAKTLHDAIISYNIEETATPSNPIDMTGFVSDPSFEGIGNNYTGNKHNLTNAWSAPSVSDGGARSMTGNDYLVIDNSENGFYAVNLWNSSSTTYYVKQTLSGLPTGRYKLTATYASDADNTATLYMSNSQTTITATGKGHFVEGSVNFTLTATEDVEIGLSSNKWFKADDFKLEYLGFDAATAIAAANEQATAAESHLTDKAYTGYIAALRNAIDAVRDLDANTATKASIQLAVTNLNTALDNVSASVTDYANLNTEISRANAYSVVETANASDYAAAISAAETIYADASEESTAATILSLQSYKVEDYTYITDTYTETAILGSWTEDFGEDLNGEGYKAGGENYWNEWNGSSVTRTGKQTIKLPAGDYAISSIGRGNTGTSGYLYYKIGDADAVTVNFLMKGNRGRGVDTSGAANFADDGEYNCDGDGFGWEYRFLTFSLTAETEVEIGVSATFANNWVSIYAPQLFTTEASVKALRLGEITVALATVPTGNMNKTVKSILDSKKSAAESASDSNTKEELTTILNELNDAIEAANNSIAAYAEVKAAIDAAKAVVLDGSTLDISIQETAYNDGTMLDSDKDATIAAIKAALTDALIAQNLVADVTPILTNPSFEDGTTGWAAQFSATADRSWSAVDDDDATDGDKEVTMYTANGWFTGFAVDQAVTLPAGYYRLTADVKSTNVEVNTYIFASTNTSWSGKDMATLGTAKVKTADTWESLETVFYVDAEKTVYLGVTTESGNWNGATYANYKADNFKLYYLGDASATMSITDAKYATFIAPYDVTIPSGVTAYTVDGVESNGSTLTLVKVTTTIPANNPVVLSSESVISETTYGRNTATEASYTVGSLTGVYTETEAPDDSYVLAKINDKVAFYLVDNDDKPTVGANRCYLTAQAGARALYFPGDEGTGIEAVNALTSGEARIFNVSGAQIPALQKGMNIVKQSNGKSYKVIVK